MPFLLSTGRDETELLAVYLSCIALLKGTVLLVTVLGAALFCSGFLGVPE